jgi:hypothetical protein
MMQMQDRGLRRTCVLEHLCPDIRQMRIDCIIHSGEDAIRSARTILIGWWERGSSQERIGSLQCSGAVKWVKVQSSKKGMGVAREFRHLQ